MEISNGREGKTTGDGWISVSATILDGVCACLSAQQLASSMESIS